MESMPDSFRTRTDSPHPFRLGNPPAPRIKRQQSNPEPTLEETQTDQDQDKPHITPNPPLSTRYIDMLLHLDDIPKFHNILAGVFSWLLLAGYLVLPGTFTSIRNSRVLSDGAGKAGKVVVKAVRNVPLLYVAGFCCGFAALGMCWLGHMWYINHKWMIDRIILPCLTNSAVGFVTTLSTIYTARSGIWSITAIVTAAVTGSCTAIMIILFLIFDVWGLAKIKKDHLKAKEEKEAKEKLEREREEARRGRPLKRAAPL